MSKYFECVAEVSSILSLFLTHSYTFFRLLVYNIEREEGRETARRVEDKGQNFSMEKWKSSFQEGGGKEVGRMRGGRKKSRVL